MSTAECVVNGIDVGEVTSTCCDGINGGFTAVLGGSSTSTLASNLLCTGDCYKSTKYALDYVETNYGMDDLHDPFVAACVEEFIPTTPSPTPSPTLSSQTMAPSQLTLSPTNSPTPPNTGPQTPQCTPCNRLHGYFQSGSGFINVSDYLNLGADFQTDFSLTCSPGYQCVPETPLDAIPADSSEVLAKSPGCCQLCLNGQSCPGSTVSASGYYFDNICQDGYDCYTDITTPIPCKIGQLCYQGIVLNCTFIQDSVRSYNTAGEWKGIFDGAYCDSQSSELGWCPAGYYCSNPETKIECPKGYWCPPKTHNYKDFPCVSSSCGPGASVPETQTISQVVIAAVVVGGVILMFYTQYLRNKSEKKAEHDRLHERHIHKVQKDFMMIELKNLREAAKKEDDLRHNEAVKALFSDSKTPASRLRKTAFKWKRRAVQTGPKGVVPVMSKEPDIMPTYDEIKEIFKSMDKDGDGVISKDELKATSLGKNLDETELDRIVDFCSQKGGGKGVSLEDFASQFFAVAEETKQEDTTDPSVPGIQIKFTDLSLHVHVHGKTFPVVNKATGVIEAKTMVALMGGSGAGKTSLLNALCGRAYYGTVTGDIQLNGTTDRIENYPDAIGFVPQDDIVHADLTVYENLIYSGLFRLPKGTTMKEVIDLADKTLEDLQMNHVRDSPVGDANTRGVSGGQKKRVNIGLELMARPKVLFLDEPTSGLDANSSSITLSSLKKLAKSGVTVVTVIHQPRYSIFELFDQVMLFGRGGRSVYQGEPTDLVEYFNNLGYQLPKGENPADWMLDVSTGAAGPTSGPHKDTATDPAKRMEMLFEEWIKYQAQQMKDFPPKEEKSEMPAPIAKISFMNQFLLFFRRSLLQRGRKFKSIALDTLLIVGSSYLAATISGVFSPIDADFEVLNIPAAFIINITLPGSGVYEFPVPQLKSFEAINEYAMIANLLFAVLLTLSSVRSLGDNKLEFFREAGSGYSVGAFFLAQITLDQVQNSIQALWAAIASYELRTSLCPLTNYILLYQLTAWFCTGWSYFFSLVIPRDNLVMTSALFVSICGTLLSGSLSFLKFEDIYNSDFFAVFVGIFSSTRWFSEWMAVSEFRALSAQFGYTDTKLDYFRRAGYALDDLEIARSQSREGWTYNWAPMFFVGMATRVTCFMLIQALNRQRMNKKSMKETFFGGDGGVQGWVILILLVPVLCWALAISVILRIIEVRSH